ncbi:nuclear transport factor 2 family protein [Streptomyces sp. NBC_00287]|uniref:nuclear transport factor 2 family protein n=1 Tax=Streptomyces sp. NBC_00287 TaxID=2975702 RepID=UPI002E28E49E|nr:nuclear transport factor 2 family protein [Streptomyces sp. NBC_00287]
MQSNEAVVAKIYADLAEGDIEALVCSLDEQIEWVVPRSLWYGGSFTGREAVGKIFERYATEWADLKVLPDAFVPGGDIVVVIGHYAGRRRETGKALWARCAHVWQLRNGVPVRFETIADTQVMVETGE